MHDRLRKALIATLGVGLVSTGALAHHGGAVYDDSSTVEVAGKVTRFEFVNPHVLIYAAVTDADGKVVEWSGELTSPNRLARAQRSTVKWHKDMFQPGDDITLIGNPARNGAPSLRLREVIDGDGRQLIGGR